MKPPPLPKAWPWRSAPIGPRAQIFRVDPDTHPQTLAVLQTRAAPIGITIEVKSPSEPYEEGCFGTLISYPGSSGGVRNIRPEIDAIHEAGGLAIVTTDLLALTLLEAPGNMGADMVLGSAQRFGVPFGHGGPHAAFFATRTAHQRSIPGVLSASVRTVQAGWHIRLALADT